MNPTYFTSPELSHRLELLGVKSQFDYWWYYPGDPMDQWDLLPGYKLQEYTKRGDDAIKAFHFSDILLPENAKKIWGDDDMAYCSDYCQKIVPAGKDHYCPQAPDYLNNKMMIFEPARKILSRYLGFRIIEDDDWQDWLTEELDKRI